MERQTLMVERNGDLPADIIIEMLLRLPVKSLIRYRCVCKSWYTLTKNPKFIHKHQKKDHNTRLLVYCTHEDENDRNLEMSYFTFFLDETLRDLSTKRLDDPPIMPVGFVGPYEGIFCLMNGNKYISLWNLVTQELRRLPKCRASLPPYTTIHDCSVGFGLDLVSNDYKLVLILTLLDTKIDFYYDFSHIAVYNLSTDSWRGFKGFKLGRDYICGRLDGTYLNGVCYWLAREEGENHVIISFNLSDEVIQEIKSPCTPELTHGPLALYNNSLSLIALDDIKNCYHVWVLKERRWITQSTIGPFVEAYNPLGLWKNGEIFLESSAGQLLLYDPDIEEMRDLGLRGLWFYVHCFKESLLSIKREGKLLEVFDIPWHILGVEQH